MTRGHTLIELTLVATILVMSTASLLPAARRYRDRAAVLGAREAFAGLVLEARSCAIRAGGAFVYVDALNGSVSVSSHAGAPCGATVAGDFDAAIVLSRGRSETRLVFDALGLGRVASETVTFRRGEAETRLIVSSYGRLRRE
jgi:type II secretory pathway pseudopilin PulG